MGKKESNEVAEGEGRGGIGGEVEVICTGWRGICWKLGRLRRG